MEEEKPKAGLKPKKESISDSKSKLIAKKDFLIIQNDFRLEIKKGEVISADLKKEYLENLKTEQVI